MSRAGDFGWTQLQLGTPPAHSPLPGTEGRTSQRININADFTRQPLSPQDPPPRSHCPQAPEVSPAQPGRRHEACSRRS